MAARCIVTYLSSYWSHAVWSADLCEWHGVLFRVSGRTFPCLALPCVTCSFVCALFTHNYKERVAGCRPRGDQYRHAVGRRREDSCQPEVVRRRKVVRRQKVVRYHEVERRPCEGTPVPQRLPIVDFEDSAEHHQLVGEAGSIGGENRFQWEESVRLRLDRTDRMMTEMHTMLQSMTARTAHKLPPVDVDSPPVASATVSAPPAMDGAAAGVSTAVLQQPDTAAASAPWPTADTTGTGICTGFSLPTVVGARASSFASSSLPMYVHVSPKLRTNIWAGQYVEIASLLPESPTDQRGYALAVGSGEDGSEPIVCVAAKPKQGPIGFQRWVKGFEMFISIYLFITAMQFVASPTIVVIHTHNKKPVRAWRQLARYDETFRAMRVAQGWQWDLIHWELRLNTQPSGDRGAGTTHPSFPGKGRNSGPPQKVCFAFSKGAPCRQPCRHSHQCRRCGANHPSIRCPRRAPTAPVPTWK